jgi:hypothetical protein
MFNVLQYIQNKSLQHMEEKFNRSSVTPVLRYYRLSEMKLFKF